MMPRDLFSILGALPAVLLWAPASAQEPGEFVQVEMRVVAGRPGAVTLDRGAEDGLRRGDRVTLRLKDGSSLQGSVTRVEERGAAAELDDLTFVAPAGTRVECLVPSARLAAPPPQDPPDPQNPLARPPAAGGARPAAPPHAPWPERADGWSEGQPLLAVGSIRVSRRFPTAAAEGAGCLRLRDCGICLHGPIVAHPFARDHSGRSRHPGAQPGDGGCGSCLAQPLGFGHDGSSVLAGSDGLGDTQCR